MTFRIIALAALLAAGSACAETAITVRSTELQAQPQADQAAIATLAENTRVDVLSRRGAWSEVKTTAGQSGWVRMLSLKPDGAPSAGAAPPKGGNPLGALSNLLTAGRTSSTAPVTTGVRGLDEEDLRRASPNFSELQKAQGFSASADAAQAFGTRSDLRTLRIDYLPPAQPARTNERNQNGY